MTPRALATDDSLERKRNAFNDMDTTTHWPHKTVLFPRRPPHMKETTVDIGPDQVGRPALTDLGMKLAGF